MSQTVNYSTKIFSFTIVPFLSVIKKFLKKRHDSLILSRQLSANAVIAEYMLKEYPYHTYSSLLFEMNTTAYDEFYQKRGQ